MSALFKSRLLSWLKISGFTLVFAALLLVLRGNYTLTGYSDATFIPGIVLFFFFLLRLLADKGTFDLVSYTFKRIWQGTRNKDLEHTVSAHEFSEGKKLERRTKDQYYWPYIVISLLFILMGATLSIIYMQNSNLDPNIETVMLLLA